MIPHPSKGHCRPGLCMACRRQIRFTAMLGSLTLMLVTGGSPIRVAAEEQLLPGFSTSGPFEEQVQWTRLESGVRILVNARAMLTNKPRRLILFATPNGSSIEQTMGCHAGEGIDWRFQIQHVAAQIRMLRDLDKEYELILAVVQAPKLSWPEFRKDNTDAGAIIRGIVQTLQADCRAADVALICHSGGGAFVWEYIATVDAIPPDISRIVFLDANYSYSDELGHGDRLLTWLNVAADHRLIVVAYDDREIEMNGKKVVGPDGGTWRASERMLRRFQRDVTIQDDDLGRIRRIRGLEGRVQFFMHRNPENKILHTALVGEMNGLLHSLTLGTPLAAAWGILEGPPAYTAWIQQQPFIERRMNPAIIPADAVRLSVSCPERNRNAVVGSVFRDQIRDLARADRETAIVRELLAGNLPNRLRRLVPVQVQSLDPTGKRLSGVVYVTSDVLSVGSDDDFFRVPLSPNSAIQVADAFRASLITTKLSDDIFAAATARMEPRPLTMDRESVDTFFAHHQMIEQQLASEKVLTLVAGIKKDIVLSSALLKRPHRVALYGWHLADGSPIQSLYAGHVDSYVDYSHGVRLMLNEIVIDGKLMPVVKILRDPRHCGLMSTEGALDPDELRRAAEW